MINNRHQSVQCFGGESDAQLETHRKNNNVLLLRQYVIKIEGQTQWLAYLAGDLMAYDACLFWLIGFSLSQLLTFSINIVFDGIEVRTRVIKLCWFIINEFSDCVCFTKRLSGDMLFEFYLDSIQLLYLIYIRLSS